MEKTKILSKASTFTKKALMKHSDIFMKRKFFMLAGILVTCLALSVGKRTAQSSRCTNKHKHRRKRRLDTNHGWLSLVHAARLRVPRRRFHPTEKPSQLLDKKLH